MEQVYMAPSPYKSPREWSKAVKMSMAGIATIGGIIVTFMNVEAWTDEKIQTAVSASEMRMIQAQARVQVANDINHDKIIQSQRLSEAKTNIRLMELELEQVEDEIEYRRQEGLEPTIRQMRALERLLDSLKIWEAQAEDAEEKLTRVSTTNTSSAAGMN